MTKRYNAYVDGSFKYSPDTPKKLKDPSHSSFGNYAWAYVILDADDNIIHESGGLGTNTSAKSGRNVSGELKATMKLVEYASSHDIKLNIHHDYIGISSWVIP
jgi:hypothetical protein